MSMFDKEEHQKRLLELELLASHRKNRFNEYIQLITSSPHRKGRPKEEPPKDHEEAKPKEDEGQPNDNPKPSHPDHPKPNSDDPPPKLAATELPATPSKWFLAVGSW